MERKLAAILAADVAGYSRLMGVDEVGTLNLLRSSREAVDSLIAAHRGRIFNSAGDSVVAEFGSAVEAIQCAVEIQQEMARRNEPVPRDKRLEFRIGLNIGDVMADGGNLFGDGVNVAARVQALAKPGGICASRNLYNQVKNKVGFVFEALGEHRVKNIAEPVTVYRMLADSTAARPLVFRWLSAVHRHRLRAPALVALLLFGAGTAIWYVQQQEAPNAGKPAIAVLPLQNIGGDEATDRLADGLTEDIITDLSQISEFDVIARNSTEVYKDKPADVRQIGRDLNVRYILEGSIQRGGGDHIRVTAQLINTMTGAHIWSDRWDRPAEDVFAVQTEIADRIVSQLEMATGPIKSIDLGAARRKRPQSLTAYDLDLLGVEKQLSPTRESIAESIELLKRAVAADPEYARAWINLAWAYSMARNFGADSESSNRLALEAAERAVALDPNDAEAHAVLGENLASRGDLGHAKTELDIALRLSPGSFSILNYYVSWASAFGEPERGAELADRAIRLNPNYKPWASGGFRYAYFSAGRYEDALNVMERQTPDNYSRYAWAERAGSFAALGRTAEAHATVKEALRYYPDLTIESIANDPGLNESERQHHIETMRLAGFPACANPEELANFENPVRLRECKSESGTKN